MKRLISLTITLLFILNGCSSSEKIGFVIRVSNTSFDESMPNLNALGPNEFSIIIDDELSPDNKFFSTASAYRRPSIISDSDVPIFPVIIPVDYRTPNIGLDIYQIAKQDEEASLSKDGIRLGTSYPDPDSFSSSRISKMNNQEYSFSILPVSPLISLTIFEYDENHELSKTTDISASETKYVVTGEYIVVEEIRGSSSETFRSNSFYSKSNLEFTFGESIHYTYYTEGEDIILNLSEVKIKW